MITVFARGRNVLLLLLLMACGFGHRPAQAAFVDAAWDRNIETYLTEIGISGNLGVMPKFVQYAGRTSSLVVAEAKTKKKSKKNEKKATAPPPPPKAIYEAPMRAVVVRSSAVGCEPNCPEWIAVEGEITSASPAVFRKALKLAGKRKLPVIIRSPGGSINHALEIGRMIRQRKLDVAVGATQFRGCKPDDKTCTLPKEQKGIYSGEAYDYGGFCNSACTFILAAGVKRFASPFTYVGVHQSRTRFTQERLLYREYYRIVNGKKKVVSRKLVSRKPGKSYEKFGLYKGLRNSLTAYLKEMGIDRAIFEDMDKALPSDINQLSLNRMLALKLITGYGTVQMLTSKDLCIGATAADSCRLVEVPKAKALAAALPEAGPGQQQAMTFTIVRGYLGLCEPLCPQWIAADGVLTPQSGKAFKAVLAELHGLPLPVMINSPGGDFDAALEIGRLIHDAKVDVVVAKTRYRDCDPGEKACKRPDRTGYPGDLVDRGACQGSCMFVLAGGKRRYISPRAALFAVHNPDEYGAKTAIPAASVKLHTYFESLGIDNALLQVMNGLQGGQEYKLAPDFPRHVKLVTAEIDPLSLVGRFACLSETAASYCVKR